VYGPKTELAVREFQKSNGLVPDGIVGPLTEKALYGMSHMGIVWLKQLEGYKRIAYKDVVGKWTIGVGHLLTSDELATKKVYGIPYSRGLTTDQVDKILDKDILDYAFPLADAVQVPLSVCQRDALISWTFNIGVGSMLKSTLIRKLNAGEYAEVPNQLVLWCRAGGRVVRGLLNRRNKEVALWSEGKYD
jgi:lysozyme